MQVRDFLMRCRSKRFPSVEKDVALVLAHSGSLHLDVAALQEAGHELVVLERLHSDPEFSPGASLQAITKRPLRLC
jgi:type III protein arginine methyltransferase